MCVGREARQPPCTRRASIPKPGQAEAPAGAEPVGEIELMSSASRGRAQDADERPAAGPDTPDTASADSLHVAVWEVRVAVDEPTHMPVARRECGQSLE
jgi:hypothetical protein